MQRLRRITKITIDHMKHTSLPPSRRRGFTLVELLVVISIIAVLAGVGFSIFAKVRETANKTSAVTCMSGLVQASDAYFEEYQSMPMSNSSPTDAEQVTNNQLMSILLGMQSAQPDNPKFIAFFEFKNARGEGAGEYDGLSRSENRAELLGPWLNPQRTDRYYRLMYNYDYDNQLREPQALGNEIIFDRNVLVYHMGKDGKVGGEFDEDNVYSWQKSN